MLLILYLQVVFKESVILTMEKLQLLERIHKLASIVHSEDLKDFNLTEESIQEIRKALDALTEKYITCYC
ncbi:hypothetical protein MAMMFC1_03312 [Methylomusa anaerophila]|uniref:Uncharacterized protein n=2 Tax=Methylomusa anaerophila TaxID=1930071 RepID=A0A348ANG9_9FIRM|nr:hypothetical protein MAMMFC1_03312 [Methylomusa anaerophila]